MGKRRGKKEWDEEPGDRRTNQAETGEELKEYIHITSPGTFVVIISLPVLLTALMIWGFIGTLPVTETVTGLVIDTAEYRKQLSDDSGFLAELLPEEGKDEIVVICFVDATRYNWQAIQDFGNQASFKTPDLNIHSGTVEAQRTVPVSMEEAKKILFDSDWLLERCVSEDYNWLLAVRSDEDLSRYSFITAEVTLLVEEVPPIRFLMK